MLTTAGREKRMARLAPDKAGQKSATAKSGLHSLGGRTDGGHVPPLPFLSHLRDASLFKLRRPRGVRYAEFSFAIKFLC